MLRFVVPYVSTLNLTADVHKQRMPAVNRTPRNFTDRFFARFDYRYVGFAVLAQETSTNVWSISTFPGIQTIPVDDLNSADRVFYGTNTYTVTGSLATALTNAGYEVS